jgi:diphthamide synthase (EF-2-diphthine--ammonia ligase)
MRDALQRARKDGIDAAVFGDLFLGDIRAYRESLLAGTGVHPVFPLWGKDTAALAAEMIAGGLRASLICVDLARLPGRFAGREFDPALLADLPAGCDPCGENGEFHTFAWAGPMFAAPVPVTRGQVEERGGFAFADLLPAG